MSYHQQPYLATINLMKLDFLSDCRCAVLFACNLIINCWAIWGLQDTIFFFSPFPFLFHHALLHSTWWVLPIDDKYLRIKQHVFLMTMLYICVLLRTLQNVLTFITPVVLLKYFIYEVCFFPYYQRNKYISGNIMHVFFF